MTAQPDPEPSISIEVTPAPPAEPLKAVAPSRRPMLYAAIGAGVAATVVAFVLLAGGSDKTATVPSGETRTMRATETAPPPPAPLTPATDPPSTAATVPPPAATAPPTAAPPPLPSSIKPRPTTVKATSKTKPKPTETKPATETNTAKPKDSKWDRNSLSLPK
jgi:hypothetical protein